MVWRSAHTVAIVGLLALVVLPSVNTSSHFSAPPGEVALATHCLQHGF